MKKNKKILLSFLAINSVFSAYSSAKSTENIKYDKMYNNIVKNFEQGKTNKNNYTLIERVLNQKNKELKDLYLQNDYIVKPEYLEWQIFFTGFYEEYGKGVDNSSENAKYHSKVNGYYDSSGNFISNSEVMGGGLAGKPYAALQKAKDINLGVSIPLKGMTKEPLNLALSPAEELNINPSTLNVSAPTGIIIPAVDVVTFQPVIPKVNLPNITPITTISIGGAGGGNGNETGFFPNGDNNRNSIISQMDLTSGTIEATTSGAAGSYSYSLTNLVGTPAKGETLTAGGQALGGVTTTGSVTGVQGILKSIDAPVTRYGAEITLSGGVATPAYLQQIYHFDEHYIDSNKWFTINGLETAGYITSAEAAEFATKYLDTSIGDTTSNKYLQYSENTGDWKLRGNAVLAMNIQAHGASSVGWTSNIAFANKGTILGLNEAVNGIAPKNHVAFMFTEGLNSYRYQVVDNVNSVELRAPESVGYSLYNVSTGLNGKFVMMNNGEMKLYGNNNVGIYMNTQTGGLVSNAQIKLYTPITLLGDESIGVDIERVLDFNNSKLKVDIGTETPRQDVADTNGVNNLENSGQKGTTGYSDQYTDNAVGLYVALATPITLTDYEIKLGEYSKSGIGLRVKNGDVTLGTSADSTSKQKFLSDGGINNIFLVADSATSKITTTASTNMELKNGKSQVGMYASNGGIITNGGELNASGEGTKGVVVETGGIVNNTGILNISGGVYSESPTSNIGTTGIAVKGGSSNFTSTGTITIDVSGRESTGLFTEGGTIDITGGLIKTSSNAFNLYSKDASGLIKLTGTTLETGQGSLLFFNENGGSFNLNSVSATIKGGTTANDRGTAFYYPGSGGVLAPADLTAYFTTVFNGTVGQLTLNMDSGSRLFIVDNVQIDLSTAALPASSLSGPTVNGTDYKTYMMYKSNLRIDQGINLDSASDAYNDLEIATSSIINNGQTITGTIAGQAALAQENGVGLGKSIVTLTNNGGNINLSGANSVAMYASFGQIYNQNNGNISTTGDNSIGIYATNGTEVTNATGSNITIGKNGVGIFAEGHKGGVAQGFGDGTLKIVNNGLIKSGTGSGAIGIYLNNNASSVLPLNSTIELSGGTIDVKDSENGIGVFIEKGALNDTSGSTITVGKNGIGIYAKDSAVNLTGTTMNLFGDNALGLYLDGTTSLNGTGTINIDGQNVVLFNMASSGSIANNFSMGTVTSGSSYTLGNIVGGTFQYTGTSTLASNGTLVTGQQSAIYLNGSTLSEVSGATNIAGILLDGQYTSGGLPAGMTAGMDGENNGTISLGDASVGIYGKNGARVSNVNVITVGNGSAGLMTSGVGSLAVNSGTITVGAGSQGIYLKDGGSVQNTSTGTITSTGTGTVGIYSNALSIPMNTTNDGTIDLTGDKSIGVYSIGTDIHTITNTGSGVIKVGDSSNVSDPSIGIYSSVAGSSVLNHGTLSSGAKSIGIYSNNGTVYNNGVMNIGTDGAGIYSSNGLVHLDTSSTLNFGASGVVGIYGTGASVQNDSSIKVGNNNYGLILKGGSFTNNANISANELGTNSVFMYSTEGTSVINNGDVLMTGSDNIGFYMAQDPTSKVGGAVMVNNGTITGTADINNIGIYNYGGTVTNNGVIAVGNSDIKFINNDPAKGVDVENSVYSVGIYGENATIINNNKVSVGYGGYGIVAKGGTASNFGIIESNEDYATGMYTEDGEVINEATGQINITGNNAVGMAGKGLGSKITNLGTINITGNDAIGMYGNIGTIITNKGTINITGGGTLFVSSDPADAHNVNSGTAIINGVIDNGIKSPGNIHTLPELINAGIIKASGVLALDGLQVKVQPDPSTATVSSDPDYDFVLSGTSIIADEVLTSKPIVILPGFADGTIANVYKLEGLIQAKAGQYDFVSGSLLWESTPKATGTGADIYMSRKAFTEFTDGLWFEDFGTALENNFLSATGEGMEIYNKTGYITNEASFRQITASLAGNVYANINQRENDIARTLENTLDILQDSTNNTKENVKVSVIAGKGKNKEKTDGVVSYDYETTGVLALREVERTYKHTFGYSLGYLHTGFEFKDGNESEEWVDTIQLGVHNKYKANGWNLLNNLTGRVSFHNVDRNIDWPDPLKRSEMNGTYETYSITSDNVLGKEFELGKKASIMPYGAFRAMYVTRPSFNESGLERVEVEGNDAWSAKPRAGIELKGSLPLGSNTAWQLKGSLDVAYEYELANLNEREKARLIAIENDYHKLSKPEEEKGTFRTQARVGVEVEDRYGIFLTGEYSTGNGKEDDYRAGITLKAVF